MWENFCRQRSRPHNRGTTTVTRTNAQTAREISDGFNASSKDWQIDRYEYSNQGQPSPGTQHVQAAIARLSAAVGGDDEILHAVAGVKVNADGQGEEFEVAVFTKSGLFHSEFAPDDTRVVVQVIPRASITALTVTDSVPYTMAETPSRLKFTAEYGNKLTLSFPLKNNTWPEADWLGDVYHALKWDLLSN
jgi:hypothetical protein